MRAVPRADTSTPIDAIRWAMFIAYATQRKTTYREAKRIYSSDKVDNEAFDAALEHLRATGEARTFKVAKPRPGRPSLFIHPGYEYEIEFDPNTESFRVAPTPTPGPLAEPYRTLAEVDPPTAAPADTHPPADTRPIIAGRKRPGAAAPAERHKKLTPEPEEAELPATALQTPDLATLPDPAPKLLSRERAYEVMRGLITRSIKERNGWGATKSELLRGLMLEGYPEGDASDFFNALSGDRPEAYLEGGLVKTLPGTPINRTQDIRFFVRTAGQAMDRDQAEFEVRKRQHASQKLRTQR